MSTLLSQTDDAISFLTERAKAEQDAESEAFERAVQRASEEVEIDDVINAMAELPERFRKQVMTAYLDKKDRKHFVYLLELLFDDAFNVAAEGIAKRKGY
jgi:DNA-directed RNA polymerase specialized sigma24 family protein